MSQASLIEVRLPDGSTKQVPQGSSALDVAASIGSRLAKAAVAAVVNDRETDLGSVVAPGDRVAIVTADSDAGRHVLRHSTAHVLAQAWCSCSPARSSPSARPSTTASITTSSCPAGAPLPTTTSLLSRNGCKKSWPPTSRSPGRRCRRPTRCAFSPTSRISARSSSASRAVRPTPATPARWAAATW